MKPRQVRFTAEFIECLGDCTPELRQQIESKIRDFINRSAENALRPERKSGLPGIWAFRVTRAVRVFYIQKKDERGTYSELFHVGPHDDYRTVERKRPRGGRQA